MLERLRKEARDAGGELIVMNGNHETLNAAGRFRHATARAGRIFAAGAAASSSARR